MALSYSRSLRLILLLMCFAAAYALRPISRNGDEASDSVYVTLSDGRVRGLIRQGVQRFLGIPFAAPPLGPRRFMPPTSPAPWNNTLRASLFKPACMQFSESAHSDVSEDCLYLNVWAPPDAKSGVTAYPVMVWIYGGSFQTGSSSIYIPSRFMTRSGNQVVVVTFNYRLGLLGYLCADDMPHELCNAGLADQRFALQWVQENIAAFGGDPSSVTLFGESAGGGSIALHLCDQRSRGLYHRGILESPGMWTYDDMNKAAVLAKEYARGVGCPPHQLTLSCLQSLELSQLMSVSVRMIPVVAYESIPDQPVRMMARGEVNDVPLIIGQNLREGNYFVSAVTSPPLSDSEYSFWMGVLIPSEAVRALATALYDPLRAVVGNWNALSQAVGDYYITCGTQLALNASLHLKSDVYSYVFTQSSPYATRNVTHTSEIPYVYARYQRFTEGDESVVTMMGSWWVSFAVQSSPNAGGLPDWPPYDPASTSPTVMNISASARLMHPFNQKYCPAWSEEYYPLIPPPQSPF